MTLLWGSLAVLLAAGVPVAFAMGASALLFFLASGAYPYEIFAQRLIGGVNSFPFLAVPFFILAGNLMSAAGMTRRLIDFADSLVGHLTGGLGHVNVVVSTLFGGMSGSATADAAFQAKFTVPEMLRHGYPLGFAAALTACSSVITPLIPPSVAFVIYGYVANTSIGRLLLAGIVPGLVTMTALMGMVWVMARRHGFGRPGSRRFSLTAALRFGRRAAWALMLPVLLVGGIGSGVFTPTEAAAVTATYALAVGLIVSREIKVADLGRLFAEAARDTAAVALILAVAGPFAWVLTVERVPHEATQLLTGLTRSPELMLLIINVFLLVVGTVLDPGPTMIVVVPILMPVINQLGIDPVHFGVIVVFNSLFGAISPPQGMILFAVLATTRIGMTELTRWLMPQFVVLLALLALFTYVPVISVALPNLVMGSGR